MINCIRFLRASAHGLAVEEQLFCSLRVQTAIELAANSTYRPTHISIHMHTCIFYARTHTFSYRHTHIPYIHKYTQEPQKVSKGHFPVKWGPGSSKNMYVLRVRMKGTSASVWKECGNSGSLKNVQTLIQKAACTPLY